MKMNIFAYTAPTALGYPPFVSINRLENGDVEVVVRGPPIIVQADYPYALEGKSATMVVPAAAWTLKG